MAGIKEGNCLAYKPRVPGETQGSLLDPDQQMSEPGCSFRMDGM